jgi:hypothetical protein
VSDPGSGQRRAGEHGEASNNLTEQLLPKGRSVFVGGEGAQVTVDETPQLTYEQVKSIQSIHVKFRAKANPAQPAASLEVFVLVA